MRTAVYWGVPVLVLVVANGLIARREHVKRSGRTVLLRLASRDTGSALAGDYMVLRYRIARRVPDSELLSRPDGRIVVKLDRKSVGRFVRIYRGEPLAKGELLLRYRYRGGLRLGAESSLILKGGARHYTRARYAELKVAPGGESVFVGLRDRKLHPLGPPEE